MQPIGRYEILRELGRGAMGVVYAATDPLIGREVAIKTIRLDSLGDDSTRADLTRRLFREAQSAGILSHPGIITIYDVGESGKDAYIVMELVEGKTLEEVLATGVPQPSATLLSILSQTADALDYAHRKGIVHRDIKPSNIMISENGMVKIADFGVAKLAASTSLTQAGFVLGTPTYMSPEQAQGREIDGRSDLFSLAVVAFRMMTGRLPFDGPTLTALLTKILWEEPEYESSGLLPSLKPAFEKAFAKNPQLRFPLCADFVREIESGYAKHKAEPQGKPALPAQESPAPVTAPPVEASPIADTTTPAAVSPEIPEEKRLRKPVWVALAGVMILALAVVFFLKTPQETKAPEPTPPPKAAATVAVPPGDPAKPVEKTMPVQAVSPETSPESKPEPPKTTDVPYKKQTPAAVRQSARPVAGTLTWSGSFPRNAILVIESQRASIGAVQGEPFPGEPVRIEVEPKEIVIRQMPSEANGWRQVMLYSGSETYSALRLRWQLKKPSGTFTWSGLFPKNAILVIDNQKASIGAVQGEPFPGEPVRIEVEPKEIVIRQMPSEANGWRQVMFYSGSERYSEITVHWKLQKH
jgi:serine/threonine protein kinase